MFSQTSFFFQLCLTNINNNTQVTYFSIFFLNTKTHFYYNVLNLLRQIFRWMVWCKPYLSLRDILEFKVCCSFKWYNLALKFVKFHFLILTSFSKKPERSKHEDIPINWNALISFGDFGLARSASLDCNNHKQFFSDYVTQRC